MGEADHNVMSVEALSPEKRIAQYRELAAKALTEAEGCGVQTQRQAYLSIASAWHSLATDLEREQAKKPAQIAR